MNGVLAYRRIRKTSRNHQEAVGACKLSPASGAAAGPNVASSGARGVGLYRCTGSASGCIPIQCVALPASSRKIKRALQLTLQNETGQLVVTIHG